MIAERYGVHHVEMQHSHFASTETAYLEEYRGRLKKAKSQMNQINVEFGPLNISSPDPVLRLETIDLTKKWIDHAVILGCPRVMVNQGTLAPEVRQSAIDTLKTINAYAKTKKVFVTMENRGGGGGGRGGRAGAPRQLAAAPRAPASALAELGGGGRSDQGIRDLGQSRRRQFPDEEARAAGLRVMYPLSSGQQPLPLQSGAIQRGQCDQDFQRGRVQRAVFDRSRRQQRTRPLRRGADDPG